tara:strand:+ start:233 stop:2284 length:2052 start_codon:yes stop_codon:yes gene_type:complete
MVKKMIRFIIFILLFIIACEDDRQWDNPFDPKSNRDFWTPQNLSATNDLKDGQDGKGQIKLTWNRKGRPSSGFIIDRKIGDKDWEKSILTIKENPELDELKSTDNIDLKVLLDLLKSSVPFEYKYRIYAYAVMENGETNVSNYSSTTIIPKIPDMPSADLKIKSVEYVNRPPKTMSIKWNDDYKNKHFKSYHIFHSFSNDFENKILLNTVNDIDITFLETTNFTVLKENWFWIGVEDLMGQKTISKNSVFYLNVDGPPESVLLDSITFENDRFKLKWSEANMNSINDDFESYTIEEVTLPDSSTTLIETIDLKDDIERSIFTNNDNETYFRVKLNDEWGNSSLSNIQPASSFQKIITLDFIRDLGDDLSIYNLGSTLYFSKKITNINAKFPIWIQNGKKIFSLIEGGAGIVINEDGSGLKQFFGHEPQDISFNSDQTKGIYTGEDHNLYYIDLNTSDGEITINTQDNNEWFSDPEIISADEILYSQIKNPNLNNLGPQGIFTSGLDGNNVDTLLLEPSSKNIKGVRYTMPRMSPLKDKILYVKENDSLYLLEIDQNRNIISNNIIKNEDEVIVPEKSKYFRNLRWSPDGTKAIFWAKKKSVYNLYIYDSSINSSEARLLQAGARYGDWIENDKVLFHMDDGVEEFMFTKNISDEPATSATKLINDDHPAAKAKVPWAQLQPRQ